MDNFQQMQLLRPVIEANRRELRALEGDIARLRSEAVHANRTGNDQLLYKLTVGIEGLTPKAAELRQALAQQEMDLSNLLRNSLMTDDPDMLFRRLVEDVPVALFPVRLETRFVGAELLIRIYPDDLHADTHEPELTESEFDAGVRFWTQTWRGGNELEYERAAWHELVLAIGSHRAEWVAARMAPLNPEARPAAPLPEGSEPPLAPQFPMIERRAAAWSRAPHTDVLPDRWVARGYRGASVLFTVHGEPIPGLLPLGPDPSALNPTSSADGLGADAGIRWLIDFDEAVHVGMGLRVPLPPDDSGYLDRLIVFGCKGTLNTVESAARLERLMQAHRYTGGLSFVRQGTPTNNTEDARAGMSSADSSARDTFERVRAPRRFTPGDLSNDDVTAFVFGLERFFNNPFSRIDHADLLEQRHAFHMNGALWRATLGYFLEEMMSPVVAPTELMTIRRHFLEFVRGRGPLPALRIGKQPYGLLPITLIDHAIGASINPRVGNTLLNLRALWQRSLANVPALENGGDPDNKLLQIVGMQATSDHIGLRSVVDHNYLLQFFKLADVDVATVIETLRQEALRGLSTIDNTILPRLAFSSFMPNQHVFDGALVYDGTGSESDGLPPSDNYIEWLLTAPHQAIEADEFSAELSNAGRKPSLLYLLLRQALRLEQYALALSYIPFEERPNPQYPLEPDYVGPESITRQTVVARFISSTGLEKIHPDAIPENPAEPEAREAFIEFWRALEWLRDLPTAELQRLLVEVLDLCSFRLDAWLTSIGTQRLYQSRAMTPQGIYLGGYGLVENLQPTTRAHVSDGYIHAPSIAHAATAAVLRSGHLTHADAGQPDIFAIDLSSARVRSAVTLLEGIREGQSLGALLGYKFERGLHEGHPSLMLDHYIAPFRAYAPLIANKREPTAEPVEAIAARNVVDGLVLLRRWQSMGESDTILDHLGVNEPPDRDAVRMELAALKDAVDSLSDAMLAESVYQLMQSNPVHAGATLDAVSRGEVLPSELEVVRTARSGIGVTHRTIILFGENYPLDTEAWPTSAYQVRAAAEPRLNAWVGRLLGDARQVCCTARYLESDEPELVQFVRRVHLSELALSPLDLLYMVASSPETPQEAELEARLFYFLAKSPPIDVTTNSRITLDFGRDPAWATDTNEIVSFAEFLEVVRAAQLFVTGLRALDARDFATPYQVGRPEIDLVEFNNRANAAQTAMQRHVVEPLRRFIENVTTLTLDEVRDALMLAAHFGITGAIPLSTADTQALLVQARSVYAEAVQRLTAAERAATPTLAELSGSFAALFGAEFRVLPRFTVSNHVELQNAFTIAVTAEDVLTWFSRATRVRDGLARFNDLMLYAEALNQTSLLHFNVGQLPHRAGAYWAALPTPEDQRLEGGQVSLIAYMPWEVDVRGMLVGALIDEWVEIVPGTQEMSAITFHYDQPATRPPQSIILAVKPHFESIWSLDSMAAIVNEVLDLAKIRTVDTTALREMGHYLPALYVAHNLKDETIATSFVREVKEG